MKQRRVGTVITAVVLGILAVGTVLPFGCSRHRSAVPEEITIAAAVIPMAAPVYVAQDKGFFRDEGLKVNLRQFWTGKEALDSVLGGEAHFCTVTETPLMFAALRGEKVAILATISDSKTFTRIIARRDRGIETARDLKGKRIGVNRGTNVEYFLHAFLTAAGLAENQVRIVDVKPEGMTDALIRGEIDAVVSWDPHYTRQQGVLGSNGVTLLDRTVYKTWLNLAAGREYLVEHQETARRVIRALIRAQDFIRHRPDEAAAIVSAYLGQGHPALGEIDFDVRLGQAFLLDLEDQARWASARLTPRPPDIPNFLEYISPEPLESVAPASVMMLHGEKQ